MRTSVPRITHVSDPDAWFIFNLYRELFFILHAHIKIKRVRILLNKKKISYLKRQSLAHGANFPNQVPCLESTALAPLAFPSTPHPLPSNRAYILQKDDINKPDTSAKHTCATVPLINLFSMRIKMFRNYTKFRCTRTVKSI